MADPVKQHDPDDRPALDVLEGMLATIRTATTDPGWFTGGERGARLYLFDALARAERAVRRLRDEEQAATIRNDTHGLLKLWRLITRRA